MDTFMHAHTLMHTNTHKSTHTHTHLQEDLCFLTVERICAFKNSAACERKKTKQRDPNGLSYLLSRNCIK